MLVLVGANMVTAKLQIKFFVSISTFARLAANWVRTLTFYGQREAEREADYASFFTHSAHSSNLREVYLRFSELNSDSRKRRNWSRPTWSFSISSKEKPHLFTRCWLGSLLLEGWGKQRFKKRLIPNINLCHVLSSKSNWFCCHMPKGNFTNLSDRLCKNLYKLSMQTSAHQYQPMVKSLFKEGT